MSVILSVWSFEKWVDLPHPMVNLQCTLRKKNPIQHLPLQSWNYFIASVLLCQELNWWAYQSSLQQYPLYREYLWSAFWSHSAKEGQPRVGDAPLQGPSSIAAQAPEKREEMSRRDDQDRPPLSPKRKPRGQQHAHQPCVLAVSVERSPLQTPLGQWRNSQELCCKGPISPSGHIG